MEQQNLPEADLAWRAAEEALAEARRMPGGRERHEALKRAGRLRLHAQRLLESAHHRGGD
jgi:hypothetical protein